MSDIEKLDGSLTSTTVAEEPTIAEQVYAEEGLTAVENERSKKISTVEDRPDVQSITTKKSEKSEDKKQKEYSTGTKISAFLFLAITLVVFILYVKFAYTFLFQPILESIHDFGEAIAAIFGYLFGFILTLGFGIAQLPENIISIILFRRLRGKSCYAWENVLFTVCFILSLVMLLVTILSFLAFIAVIALG